MKLKAFAVFDSKAGAYLPPFFFQATGQAIRAFSDTVNDRSTTLAKHPGDYTLFELGEFDSHTGYLAASNPINLGTALAFKEVGQDPKQLDLDSYAEKEAS